MYLLSELSRNSQDWKRTRQDAKLENSRKNCTSERMPPVMLDPLARSFPAIRSLRAQPGSVPIAARWDISRQTKSMEPQPFSPPPRPSFDWWSVTLPDNEELRLSRKKSKKKRLPAMVLTLQELDKQKKKDKQSQTPRQKHEAKIGCKKRAPDGPPSKWQLKKQRAKERLEKANREREEREELLKLKERLQKEALQYKSEWAAHDEDEDALEPLD